MDLGLSEKVVLVTGGASGIGAAISQAFADEGATVIIAARRRAQADEILASLHAMGRTAHVVQVELTDGQQCRDAFAWVGDNVGKIDVLVNNAGVNDQVSLEAGAGAFRESLEKNLVQVYRCAHLALPYLLESRGNIVNVGSKVAVTGQGGTSGYAASKGGVNALTREWAVHLAGDGIRVNCVVPAEVMTPLYERWLRSSTDDPERARRRICRMIPFGQRMTTMREIANAVVFVASSASSHTTGQILYVDGGYSHFDRSISIRKE